MGIWAEDGKDIVFLLEYDTGTEHLAQLAGKLPGYAERARYKLLCRAPLLFCFPAPRREQAARKALAATRASRELQIATAALDPRATCPACEARWMRLIDLGDVLPDPWRVQREQEERERREEGRRETELDTDD